MGDALIMKTGFTWFRTLGRSARGANAIEYCLIGALLAAGLVATVGSVAAAPAKSFEDAAAGMGSSMAAAGQGPQAGAGSSGQPTTSSDR